MLSMLFGMLSGLFLASMALAQTARDDQWLKLMHYQRGWGAAYRSSIDSPDFFMTAEGRRDPEIEWKAARELLQRASWQYQGKEVDPQCLFPARTRYFRRLGLLAGAPRPCPEYEAFRSHFELESMSVVFSTAYAGNSASMFGHTLLKLNRRGSDSARALLDYGVAFLALSDPNDGALYALKGLLGGYPGFYTVQNYYELVNQYAYSENRDLWELPIALDAEEKDILIAHLWELSKGASAPYYFTHVNCASMLAELIDVAKPQWHIRSTLHGFVMPSELMRRVAAKTGPVVMGFRPSQRRRWLHHVEALNPEQLALYRKLWDAQELQGTPAVSVLDTLLDRVTIEKGALNLEKQKPLRAFEQDILRARSSIKTASPQPDLVGSNNPVSAHGPKRIEMRAGAYDNEFLYGLRLRAGWHDLLDSPEGFEPYYQLNYFNLTADKLRSATTLHTADLTLAEVWSLNPWRRDEHILSWSMAGGLDYREGQRSIVFKGMGGISGIFGSMLLSLLPGAELRGNLTEERMEAKALLRLQALARWTTSFRSLLVAEPAIDDRDRKEIYWSLENRLDAANGYQAIVKAEHEEKWQWEIGLARNY